MTTAAQYARALFALLEDNPKDGPTFLRNLPRVLEHRGHQKLLPHIFAEYRKLAEANERRKQRATVTPEQERTRILLELYRTLVTTQ